MEYRQEMPVRFGEIDRAGVVYYPNFFHYYHCAFEEFFGAVHGTPYPQWISERRIGFPTRHLEADFARPVRYGESLVIAITVPRVGRTSMDLRFEARGAGGAAVAWSVATKVCVGLDDFLPRPIPDDLRNALARYREP